MSGSEEEQEDPKSGKKILLPLERMSPNNKKKFQSTDGIRRKIALDRRRIYSRLLH